MKRDWEIPELQDYWTLQPPGVRLVASETNESRLGFSLLSKYFQLQSVKTNLPPWVEPDQLIWQTSFNMFWSCKNAPLLTASSESAF
jgi:hypothetical protein